MLTVGLYSGSENLAYFKGAFHDCGTGAQPPADIEVALSLTHGFDARAAVGGALPMRTRGRGSGPAYPNLQRPSVQCHFDMAWGGRPTPCETEIGCVRVFPF